MHPPGANALLEKQRGHTLVCCVPSAAIKRSTSLRQNIGEEPGMPSASPLALEPCGDFLRLDAQGYSLQVCSYFPRPVLMGEAQAVSTDRQVTRIT